MECTTPCRGLEYIDGKGVKHEAIARWSFIAADGVEMPLEEGTSAFITMNPGYIGRAGAGLTIRCYTQCLPLCRQGLAQLLALLCTCWPTPVAISTLPGQELELRNWSFSALLCTVRPTLHIIPECTAGTC